VKDDAGTQANEWISSAALFSAAGSWLPAESSWSNLQLEMIKSARIKHPHLRVSPVIPAIELFHLRSCLRP
jgi:hypothetical protein